MCFVFCGAWPPTFLASPATLNLFDNPGDKQNIKNVEQNMTWWTSFVPSPIVVCDFFIEFSIFIVVYRQNIWRLNWSCTFLQFCFEIHLNAQTLLQNIRCFVVYNKLLLYSTKFSKQGITFLGFVLHLC